eukprot:9368474-Alexandrium_andersonii.AAC.1
MSASLVGSEMCIRDSAANPDCARKPPAIRSSDPKASSDSPVASCRNCGNSGAPGNELSSSASKAWLSGNSNARRALRPSSE